MPAEVAGRYLPRVLLEQYRMGITRTFLYELCDFPNSGSYGLLTADGAPKPTFNAVKGLLRLLADPGPPIALRPLAYQIAGSDSVRHIAFQKRDGTYFLALWLEEASYDVPVRQHTSVAGQTVSVTLPEPHAGDTRASLGGGWLGRRHGGALRDGHAAGGRERSSDRARDRRRQPDCRASRWACGTRRLARLGDVRQRR